MSLTKMQTAAACLLVAAVPLTFQWQASARLVREQSAADDRLAQAGRRTEDIERELEQALTEVLNTQAATMEAERRRDLLNAQRAGRSPIPHYQWDDSSLFVRVPKAMLAQLELESVSDKRGNMSEQIKEVLQLNDSETEEVQAAINRFVSAYNAVRAASVRKAEPSDEERRWRPNEEVRVFEMPDVTGQFKTLRETLFAEIAGALGQERSDFFRKKLESWMPIDDGYHGMSTARAIVPEAHRVRFSADPQEFPALGWAMSEEGGYVSCPMRIEEIPDYLRPELQDWIAAAQSKAAK